MDGPAGPEGTSWNMSTHEPLKRGEEAPCWEELASDELALGKKKIIRRSCASPGGFSSVGGGRIGFIGSSLGRPSFTCGGRSSSITIGIRVGGSRQCAGFVKSNSKDSRR